MRDKNKERKVLDNDLIKLFAKYYFRNLPYGTTTFNSMKYSQKFIDCINAFYKQSQEDNKYPYYSEYQNILKDNLDIKLNKNNYLEYLKSYKFKEKSATYMLMYLETCESPDNVVINLDLTLEHIFPRKLKDSLQIKNTFNYIGNLALLQGGNSENGNKGNYSIGCKPYEDKKKSYQESHLLITSDIVRNFPGTVFGESEIKQRTDLLAIIIEKNTRYFK
jgi:hypothetical protein